MGSGLDAHRELAEPLGRWLAGEGVHLLTGGGQGVMAAVSRAFAETPNRQGLVIGVLPLGDDPPYAKDGYPNEWVEIPIRTHLPFSGPRGQDKMSRNHINILTADVVIALPGGDGTVSEIMLALNYGKAVIAYVAGEDDIPGLPAAVPTTENLDEVKSFVHAAAEVLGG